MNVNSLESSTHQTLDTTEAPNIEPISTRAMETAQTTSIQHDHDHDDVKISASCGQMVTIQVEKESTSVNSQHTQIFELLTNSQKSLELPVINSQLQSNVGPNTELIMTMCKVYL